MTKIRSYRFLSLLLAILLVVGLVPTAALAAELPDEECHCEECDHEHCDDEYCSCYECMDDVCSCEDCEAEELTEPIEENGLIWEVDEYGSLYVTITGTVPVFASADDQPWSAYRNEIRYAYVQDESRLTTESVAYWFSGCTALNYAEISGNVAEIGYHTFYNCPNLRKAVLLHDAAPVLIQGAFETQNPMNWEPDNDPTLQIKVYSSSAFEAVCAYNWGADDCPITVTQAKKAAPGLLKAAPLLAAASSGTGYCPYCKTTCAYTLDYVDWTDNIHCIRHWCSNCGYDQCEGVNAGNHSYNNSGYCTYCGHYNSAYDNSTCYHTSTYTTWSGCNWYKYCNNCGALVDSGVSHGTTYTTWSGCNWYEYCRNCGQLMNSGISHSYSYGSWEYYNSTRHRRTETCTVCGATAYSYENHSTQNKYTSISSTQHQYGKYCSKCGSYVGSTTKSSHTFTYSNWTTFNGDQHRRQKTCSACGYSEYEYSNHSPIYGTWEYYSTAQHRRSVRCSACNHDSYEYASHSMTPGNWSSISDTQHQRTLTCTCGYSKTEKESHSFTYGSWQSISDTQHQRTISCSCGYNKTEKSNHMDNNSDGCCDDCGYLLTHFSVTVPANLTLTVSQDGTVHAAVNAAIVNNSTGAVKVSGVTVQAGSGWTLVPYSTNMANIKVDTKQIGFTINNAVTKQTGASEALTLGSGWNISKNGNLPLTYDAVVSALSEPVNEQVLTLIFVLDWAA